MFVLRLSRVNFHSLLHFGAARLTSGHQTAGRVEIFYDRQWGTVCNNGWDKVDALVVCRQLGMYGAWAVSSEYGEGEGQIHFNELACNGEEVSLHLCSRSNEEHDCQHTEDAGVKCGIGGKHNKSL